MWHSREKWLTLEAMEWEGSVIRAFAPEICWSRAKAGKVTREGARLGIPSVGNLNVVYKPLNSEQLLLGSLGLTLRARPKTPLLHADAESISKVYGIHT